MLDDLWVEEYTHERFNWFNILFVITSFFIYIFIYLICIYFKFFFFFHLYFYYNL